MIKEKIIELMDKDLNLEPLNTLIKDFERGVGKGERNNTGVKIASLLRSKTIDKELVLIILNGWNRLNDPPLLTIEIESIIQSVFKCKKLK